MPPWRQQARTHLHRPAPSSRPEPRDPHHDVTRPPPASAASNGTAAAPLRSSEPFGEDVNRQWQSRLTAAGPPSHQASRERPVPMNRAGNEGSGVTRSGDYCNRGKVNTAQRRSERAQRGPTSGARPCAAKGDEGPVREARNSARPAAGPPVEAVDRWPKIGDWHRGARPYSPDHGPHLTRRVKPAADGPTLHDPEPVHAHADTGTVRQQLSRLLRRLYRNSHSP